MTIPPDYQPATASGSMPGSPVTLSPDYQLATTCGSPAPASAPANMTPGRYDNPKAVTNQPRSGQSGETFDNDFVQAIRLSLEHVQQQQEHVDPTASSSNQPMPISGDQSQQILDGQEMGLFSLPTQHYQGQNQVTSQEDQEPDEGCHHQRESAGSTIIASSD